MKVYKTLLIIAVITFAASISGIKAYTVEHLQGIKVDGFNRSYYYTENIDTSQMGRHHKLRDVRVGRSLDVRLEKSGINSAWKELNTNQNVVLTNSNSSQALYMQGGNFTLHVDSRINYFSQTNLDSVLWYLEI